MAYFEVLSWHLPGRTEVSTQDVLNMNASHMPLTFNVYVMVL